MTAGTMIPALAALTVLVPFATADSIAPGFAGSYTLTDLGTPNGVPEFFGGVAFVPGNPNQLLLGGDANDIGGAIYLVGLTRDSTGHINGFSGPATVFASAPYIDGTIMFAPGGVLLFTGFPTNTLGELKPGSTTPDKTVDLTAAGVNGSVGGTQVAPNGQFSILSYGSGEFYTATLSPDGSGTYDVTGVTLLSNPGAVRGPEGGVFVPAGSPLFSGNYMLMPEFNSNSVGAYLLDSNFNLQPSGVAGRLDFMDLGGAEGAAFDPLTNDLVLSTFAASFSPSGLPDHIDVVTGFAAPTPEPTTLLLLGTALLGAGIAYRRKYRKKSQRSELKPTELE